MGPSTSDVGVGLERIKQYSRRLARAPVNSRRRGTLTEAIRIEADVYRKSLDTEQVMATHDPHRPTVRRVMAPMLLLVSSAEKNGR
jgi:hypothetical protein